MSWRKKLLATFDGQCVVEEKAQFPIKPHEKAKPADICMQITAEKNLLKSKRPIYLETLE